MNIIGLHIKAFPDLLITPLEFINPLLETEIEFIEDIPQNKLQQVQDEYYKHIFVKDDTISYYELFKKSDYLEIYSHNIVYPTEFKILKFNDDYEYGIIRRNHKEIPYLRFYELTILCNNNTVFIDIPNNLNVYQNETETYYILTDKFIPHNSETLTEYSESIGLKNGYTLFSKHNAFLIPLDVKLISETKNDNKLIKILNSYLTELNF